MRVIGDDESRKLAPGAAVAAMKAALRAGGPGRLVGSPRVSSRVNDLGYVFTVGGVEAGPTGFRVYRSEPSQDRPEQHRMRSSHNAEQLVAVWDSRGKLAGIVAGAELGARRTGALGGVAVDALARSDAKTLGLVGTGMQAWAQLWAASCVRSFDDVRLFSPDRTRRESFAARARAELGLPARATDSAKDAVADRDVVILATNSSIPVIEASWVSAGTHVNTIGPKWREAHETPLELVSRSALFVSDSPEQAGKYPSPFFTDTGALVALADVVAGRTMARRSASDVTLYCSVGVAGSEVVLASLLLGVS